MIALDLFAGTGWGVACQVLGIEEHGVELAPAAVATRAANGMRTAFHDVWDGLRHPHLVPEHALLIASPPCQPFSMAGAGAGRRALTEVLALIESGAWLDPDELQAFGRAHDDRTALVLTPLAYAIRYRPEVVVLEQVPTVLPVWQAIARVLGMNGYQVATGVLNAEQYGVPQTRRRAILVARRGGPVALPTPTHSAYHPRDPKRLDSGVLPWVSMADALGWNPGAARTMRGAGMIERSGRRLDRAGDTPAPTVMAGGGGNASPGWTFVRPATTIVGSFTPSMVRAPGRTKPQHDGGEPGVHSQNRGEVVRVTAAEAAALQSYPAGFQWVGTKTETFRQIGNAVPPLMGLRVLEAALGTVAPAAGVGG